MNSVNLGKEWGQWKHISEKGNANFEKFLGIFGEYMATNKNQRKEKHPLSLDR